MRYTSPLVLFACAAALPAQVTQIPAMTQPTSVIDMDSLPVGPTTLAALMAAGTNGGAILLSGVTLTPSANAAGIYNTNASAGNALSYEAGSGGLEIIAPQASFDAFTAQLDMLVPVTQVGISIGDWVSTMSLTFLSQGSVVGTITTPSFSSADAKFFESAVPFDQVQFDTASGGGNWVIPELHIQNGFGTTATNTVIGAGCGGLALAGMSRPVIGTSWTLDLTGIPATGTIGAEIFGLTDPGINDLTSIGLPGCGLRAALDIIDVFVVGGASHVYSLPLPLDPMLVGLHVYTTAAVFENPPSNAFGAVTANGVDGLLGDV